MFSFNLQVFPSKSGKCCRNWSILYIGKKVHKLNSNASLHSMTCRSLEPIYCTSPENRYSFYRSRLYFLFALGPFCLQVTWIQVRWLTWPLQKIPLLCFKKSLGLLSKHAPGHCPSAPVSTVQWVLKHLAESEQNSTCCLCQLSHHQ